MVAGPISERRNTSADARLRRSRAESRELPLRNLVRVVASLAFSFAPALAAAAGPADAPSDFQRTIAVGGSSIDLRVRPTSASSASGVSAGEGSVGTALPGEGQLTFRLPWVAGQAPAIGTAQLAASYDLAKETELVPKIAVVARVDLPTAPGARGARPGVQATVAKRLDLGPIETIRVESGLWTDGPSLSRSYRAAFGTTFRLLAATTASVDLVAVRPGAATGSPSTNLAQLGLSQKHDAFTNVRVGVAASLADGVSPLHATLGFEHRF